MMSHMTDAWKESKAANVGGHREAAFGVVL
jgi:hypothetical protein